MLPNKKIVNKKLPTTNPLVAAKRKQIYFLAANKKQKNKPGACLLPIPVTNLGGIPVIECLARVTAHLWCG